MRNFTCMLNCNYTILLNVILIGMYRIDRFPVSLPCSQKQVGWDPDQSCVWLICILITSKLIAMLGCSCDRTTPCLTVPVPCLLFGCVLVVLVITPRLIFSQRQLMRISRISRREGTSVSSKKVDFKSVWSCCLRRTQLFYICLITRFDVYYK